MTIDLEPSLRRVERTLLTRSTSCRVGLASEMARHLLDGLQINGLKGLVVYAPATCDLDGLAAELARSCGVPLFGCTTAGAIGPGGWTNDVVAVAFGGDATFETFSIDLAERGPGVERCAARVREIVAIDPTKHTVCVILHDGLSGCEESLNSELQAALGPTALIGGSAGDDLAFQETKVLVGTNFASKRAGVLALSTSAPVQPFKFQHFAPGQRSLVITQADIDSRTVSEIDGVPAVDAYCELTGVTSAELSSRHFAANPIVIEIDGDAYVRSIQRANPDGSLVLFCAIEEGVVCSIGRAMDPLEAAQKAMTSVRQNLGQPQLTLGFDCILRALEARDKEFAGRLAEAYRDQQVVGFHTYGETIYGLHINQTFTGLAFGRSV